MIGTQRLGPRQMVIIAFASSTLAIFFLSSWWLLNCRGKPRKRKDRNDNSTVPTEWHLFGKLTALTLYPLKSGRGVYRNEAEATSLGLKSGLLRDRFYIVYDEKGNFVTGRKYPKMVLITVSATENGSYNFEAPGNQILTIHSPEELSKREYGNQQFTCRLWGDKVCGLDAGDDAAKWISQLLLAQDSGLRIGCYVPDVGVERSVTQLNKVYKCLAPEDTGAFSDLAAFMLISEDSVADLNNRLGKSEQVSCANFRPNLVIKCVDGGKAFAEDNCEWIRVGSENGPVFRNVKPCTRCIFITVNPETGIINQNKEPLATLKMYRQLVDPEAVRLEGKAPVMGINLGLYSKGNLHVGDPVYVGVLP